MHSRTELLRQLKEFVGRSPALSSETAADVFPLWILYALATGDEQSAAESMCGGPHDRCVDALHVDRKNKRIWIIQGKLREQVMPKNEPADEVREFASLVDHLREGRGASSDPTFWTDIDRNARGAGRRFDEASRLVRQQHYAVNLVFASLWKFDATLKAELQRKVSRSLSSESSLDLLGWREVERLLRGYIYDIAPAVPVLKLPILGGELRESDMGSDNLSAWTISASGKDIARLFDVAGPQLFARNVRRYLGDDRHVNIAIADTIRKKPENFWFLNNGVTITCDAAELSGNCLVLTGAQVINGQQTTRSIHAASKSATTRSQVARCQVAVRVIRFDHDDEVERDTLISSIVEATNHQNSVSAADLRSNDPVQIRLERALAARGYRYIRKKSSAKERATDKLAHLKRKLTKEQVAQAVAGAEWESIALREGQTPLFDAQGKYERIFDRSVERILVCHHLWNAVNAAARGDTSNQAAKFMVHYHFYQEQHTPLMQRASRFISSMERRDERASGALQGALDALFRVARASFKANRKTDEKTYEVKPYYQSKDVDAYRSFRRSLNGAPSAPARRKYSAAIADLRSALADES